MVVITLYQLRVLHWNNSKKVMKEMFLPKNTIDALIGDFYSYLSDESNQDVTTDAAHITDLVYILVKK